MLATAVESSAGVRAGQARVKDVLSRNMTALVMYIPRRRLVSEMMIRQLEAGKMLQASEGALILSLMRIAIDCDEVVAPRPVRLRVVSLLVLYHELRARVALKQAVSPTVALAMHLLALKVYKSTRIVRSCEDEERGLAPCIGGRTHASWPSHALGHSRQVCRWQRLLVAVRCEYAWRWELTS